MWKETVLLLFICIAVSSGCQCSEDETTIDCLEYNNVAPSELFSICASNENVQTISIGYSIYCYRNFFPSLQDLYVGGGAGSNCDCYDAIKCVVDIANCDCDTSITNSPSISSSFVSIGSTSTIPPSWLQDIDGVVSTLIFIIIVVVIIFCVVIFVSYKHYLKLRNEMQSYCDNLLTEDNPRLDDQECASVSSVPNVNDVGVDITAGIRPPADAEASICDSANFGLSGPNLPTKPSNSNASAVDVVEELAKSDHTTNSNSSGVLHEFVLSLDGPEISPVDGVDHSAKLCGGVQNDAFVLPNESGIKLIGDCDASCSYKKLASGPTIIFAQLYGWKIATICAVAGLVFITVFMVIWCFSRWIKHPVTPSPSAYAIDERNENQMALCATHGKDDTSTF